MAFCVCGICNEHKREMYRELLFTGKLAEHCKAIDTAAFEQSEQIQAIADEIVLAELIYT